MAGRVYAVGYVVSGAGIAVMPDFIRHLAAGTEDVARSRLFGRDDCVGFKTVRGGEG